MSLWGAWRMLVGFSSTFPFSSQVDKGVVPLAGTDGETTTQGRWSRRGSWGCRGCGSCADVMPGRSGRAVGALCPVQEGWG